MLGEVLTAIVTPFDKDGRVDLDAFRELALYLVENGSDGLVVCGTTGESPTLSDAEKLDLFRVAVDEVGGRATVIAGTGTYDTGHSAALTKEATKLGVLDYILQPQVYDKLYGELYHKVRIEYYPPRGDAKEGWDNIDLFGWLGYPMQIKIDFLCRDSILAAPIVLDLALLIDFAKRAGFSGVQEWLSFYFKCPMTAPELYPEHDLFIQLMKLKNTLRWMMGEDLITHLGAEYYD